MNRAELSRLLLSTATEKTITGSNSNPLITTSLDGEKAAQRQKVMEFFREIFDAGWDRMTIIETLLGGAAFFGDNLGVSRERMCQFLAKLSLDESGSKPLIYSPTR